MVLHGMMQANIMAYSLMIAAAVGLICYVVMTFAKPDRKQPWAMRLLVAVIIASAVFFIAGSIQRKYALAFGRQQLEGLRSSLAQCAGVRVYCQCSTKLFIHDGPGEIFISDPEVISEILSLIDGSLLEAAPASGLAATMNRFDFEIINPGEVIVFSIIANKVLEIRSEKGLSRYYSANLVLGEQIEAVLRQSLCED